MYGAYLKDSYFWGDFKVTLCSLKLPYLDPMHGSRQGSSITFKKISKILIVQILFACTSTRWHALNCIGMQKPWVPSQGA